MYGRLEAIFKGRCTHDGVEWHSMAFIPHLLPLASELHLRWILAYFRLSLSFEKGWLSLPREENSI